MFRLTKGACQSDLIPCVPQYGNSARLSRRLAFHEQHPAYRRVNGHNVAVMNRGDPDFERKNPGGFLVIVGNIFSLEY